MKTRTILFALALLVSAGSAHAQDRTLERIQNLIATGRLTEARNTLMQWERDNAKPNSPATSDDRARALYLTGALSTDANAAEDAFIGVVLSYPSSPVAPEALLRLGQGLYTAGEMERAIMYLDRLRSDYPRSPQRETGLLWLTRAQLASGDAALACGTARESLFGTTNENVRTLIELERDRACTESGGIATNPPRPRDLRGRNDARTRDAQPAADPARVPGNDPARAGANAPRGNATASAAAASGADSAAASRAAGARQDTAASISPARRAHPLPDLGIAVDENVRDTVPARQPPRTEPAAGERPPLSDTRPAANETRTVIEIRTGNETRTASEARAGGNQAATPTQTAEPPRTQPAAANAPEYAVQTAAFSERRPAETIVAELRAKGFEARIVQVPGSPYYRVRYGAFTTSRDAAAAALRIRDAGFATLIVNDVRLEQRL